jgi:hypothetical protein
MNDHDPADVAYVAEQARKEEAEAIVLLQTLLAEIHARIRHDLGSLVSENVFNRALAQGILTFNSAKALPNLPHNQPGDDFQTGTEIAHRRYAMILAHAQQMATAAFVDFTDKAKTLA